MKLEQHILTSHYPMAFQQLVISSDR